MKQLFLLLTISLLWLGCNKEEPISPTIVNGQVIEQGSNKPLEGVKVVLMEGTFSGSSGTHSYYPIDTFLTDKQGKYSYEHKLAVSQKTYELWYFNNQYFDISNISNNEKTTRVKLNETVATNIKMIPFAWLKVKLLNAFHKYDYLYLAGPWDSSYSEREYVGKNIDYTFIKKIEGNTKKSIFWNIRNTDSNAKGESFQDTIMVKGLDTLLYQIRY